MELLNLLWIAILIALTAFFVATEFAIVKVRTSRIDQLIAEGKPGALSAKKVITHLDEYLSACQLGITVTALGLGWLGEPTVAKLLQPLFDKTDLSSTLSHAISVAIAFILVTFLHVVIGELAPKTVAIQKAEQITILFAKPIILFYKILYPFIWALNGSARFLTGLFGLEQASEHDIAHSEEELRLLLSESYKSGEINKSELQYVNNIFEFDERLAKEIMVPRTEIISLSIDDSIEEAMQVIRNEKFTRYPIMDGDKDHIIGMVNIKNLFTVNITDTEKSIQSLIQPVITVIETIPIHDLLIKMQKERIHMAVLIDEYGGTSGLVTVEDILEEIVGEIRDEFDGDEVADIQKILEGHYIFSSKVLIEDVNDTLAIQLDDKDIDTIGGWFLSRKHDVQLGDKVEEHGYLFTVKELDGHHIISLEAKKIKAN